MTYNKPENIHQLFLFLGKINNFFSTYNSGNHNFKPQQKNELYQIKSEWRNWGSTNETFLDHRVSGEKKASKDLGKFPETFSEDG